MFFRLLAALLVLVAVPGALAVAQQPVDVALPAHFSVSAGILMTGSVQGQETALSNLTVVGARELDFDQGTLTVCPVDAAHGVVPSTLAVLTGDCLNGESFPNADALFSGQTNLIVAGKNQFQASGLVTWTTAGDGATGVVLTNQSVVMQRPGDLFRLAPATTRSSVKVVWEDHVRYYNGTGFAFVDDAATGQLHAAGLVGKAAQGLHLQLAPVNDPSAATPDPFVLLDLQEALVGQGAREPRANVSGLLREFGRVPAIVDGSLVGRLDGQVGVIAFDGTRASLVRGTRFDLTLNETRMVGTVEPVVILNPALVAVDGKAPAGAPWAIIAILWIIAGAALVLRREAPIRPTWVLWCWRAAWVVALILVDQAVLRRLFDVSALQQLQANGKTGAILALATFEALVAGLAWLALGLPGRIIASRIGRKAAPILDAVWAVAWIGLVVLMAQGLFALTYRFARL